jgi:hypothetical protein
MTTQERMEREGERTPDGIRIDVKVPAREVPVWATSCLSES